MSTIPKHMQINLTIQEPSKELIKVVINLPWHKAKGSIAGTEVLDVGNLCIFIKWKSHPLAKLFRRWECINIDSPDIRGWFPEGQAKQALIIYDDHTRMYHPGDWEKEILERG